VVIRTIGPDGSKMLTYKGYKTRPISIPVKYPSSKTNRLAERL